MGCTKDFDRYQKDCDLLIGRQIIQKIVCEVKRGKEATVLCCKAHPEYCQRYLAVKIFKTGQYRNFKNKAGYLQGKVWDRRLLKRMARVREELWMETEFRVLDKLYRAEVSVPRPYDLCEHLLIMDFIGEEALAAPLLKDLSFEKKQARVVLDLLVTDVDRMLYNGVVHGDLSSYNILYHAGKPIIIDFPQAVDPSCHQDAGQLFLRDIVNVCEYFSDQGIGTNAYNLARELWRQYYPPEF